MAEQKSTWDEVKQLAQELELKMHLAQMDARWQPPVKRSTTPSRKSCRRSAPRFAACATTSRSPADQ
jgi:hypothetical protein